MDSRDFLNTLGYSDNDGEEYSRIDLPYFLATWTSCGQQGHADLDFAVSPTTAVMAILIGSYFYTRVGIYARYRHEVW